MRKLLLTFLLVAGAVHAGDPVRDATPKELAAIKANLELRLKDASSAKLQRVRVKGEKFCGLVNAKNSYGAYAGYSPISGMVFKDTTGKQLAAVIGIGPPEDAIRQICEDDGLPLPPA